METITTLFSITPTRPWGLDIPNYFYFTGSSVACFMIFCLSFSKKNYKPIAGFSLLLAFIFIIAAPFNLLDDLKQPSRMINFFLYGWENFPTSPMKWGVILLMSYYAVAFATSCVFYRKSFAKIYSKTNSNFVKFVCKAITFNNLSLEKDDEKSIKTLASIGFFIAIGVEFYTGYLLGAVYSVSLWHSAVMPLLFLISGMVSGIAMLVILLSFFQKFFTEFKKVDINLIANLMKLLAWFILVELIIRFFWLTFSITFGNDEKYSLWSFLSSNLEELILVEYVICLILPMIIGFMKRVNLSINLITCFVCAVGVWLFRYSLVIGGQSIGKTTAGFLEYSPHIFEQGGVISVVSNWGIFIALLMVIMAIFPWDKEMNGYYKGENYAK